MKLFFVIAAASTCLSLHAAEPEASPSAASPSPSEAKPIASKPSVPEPARISVTHHSVTINGKVIKYKASAGYLTLSDEKGDKETKLDAAQPEAGKPKARVFFISYTLEDGPSRAPNHFRIQWRPWRGVRLAASR